MAALIAPAKQFIIPTAPDCGMVIDEHILLVLASIDRPVDSVFILVDFDFLVFVLFDHINRFA